VKEVRQILRKSRRTIYRWIDKGFIKAIKVNGRYLIRSEEVQRILGTTAEEMQRILKELGIDEN